jgi:hypothetical protein
MAAFVPSVGGMVMNGADATAETVPRQWVTARGRLQRGGCCAIPTITVLWNHFS